MEIAKRIRLSYLAWFFFVVLSTLWQSASSAFAKHSVIPLLVTEQAIFSESTESGPQGYVVTLGQRIIREAGYTPDVLIVPRARQESLLNKGHLSLASALVKTPQRESDYYWITPLSSTRWELFVKQSHPLTRDPQASLSALDSASAVRGELRETLLKESGVGRILQTNTWSQAVEAVVEDRVSGVLFSKAGLSVVCKGAQLNCDDLVPVVDLGEQLSYMVVPKRPEYAEIAQKLQQAAKEVISQPDYQLLADDLVAKLSAKGLSSVVSNGILYNTNSPSELAKDLWVMAEPVAYFSEQTRKGEARGYATEYVTSILHHAGIAKDILYVPWERIAKESKKANVLAFLVARTQEREDEFYWITPIARNMHALYGMGEGYTSFDEVPKNKRIGVLENDYRQQVAVSAGFKVTEFETYRDAVYALLQGQVDYVFSSIGGISRACRQLVNDCSDVRLAAEYKRVTLYLALTKKGTDPLLAKVLQEAVKRVNASDGFSQWQQKWDEAFKRSGRIQHHFDGGVVNLWHEEK